MFPPAWMELYSLWPSGPPSTPHSFTSLGGKGGVGMTSGTGRGSSESSFALGRKLPAVSPRPLWSSGRASAPGWPASGTGASRQGSLPDLGAQSRKHTRARFWLRLPSCFYHEHRCYHGLQLLTPLSSLCIVQNLGGKKDCYLCGPQRPQGAWVANIEMMGLQTTQSSMVFITRFRFHPMSSQGL